MKRCVDGLAIDVCMSGKQVLCNRLLSRLETNEMENATKITAAVLCEWVPTGSRFGCLLGCSRGESSEVVRNNGGGKHLESNACWVSFVAVTAKSFPCDALLCFVPGEDTVLNVSWRLSFLFMSKRSGP